MLNELFKQLNAHYGTNEQRTESYRDCGRDNGDYIYDSITIGNTISRYYEKIFSVSLGKDHVNNMILALYAGSPINFAPIDESLNSITQRRNAIINEISDFRYWHKFNAVRFEFTDMTGKVIETVFSGKLNAKNTSKFVEVVNPANFKHCDHRCERGTDVYCAVHPNMVNEYMSIVTSLISYINSMLGNYMYIILSNNGSMYDCPNPYTYIITMSAALRKCNINAVASECLSIFNFDSMPISKNAVFADIEAKFGVKLYSDQPRYYGVRHMTNIADAISAFINNWSYTECVIYDELNSRPAIELNINGRIGEFSKYDVVNCINFIRAAIGGITASYTVTNIKLTKDDAKVHLYISTTPKLLEMCANVTP